MAKNQVYLNKRDREAAQTIFLIYRNTMESGCCLMFTESGEEDVEAHMALVDKIDSLFEKIR
ncbi:hypothetical protein MHB77_30610 [Paenibacillus sp. FSL K6-3166]|uniref:hypothetical protein n=1 Tax=Paenibacillus sp. FSL K6-3166 TaxID=2921492 RepID=UPI0030FB110C